MTHDKSIAFATAFDELKDVFRHELDIAALTSAGTRVANTAEQRVQTMDQCSILYVRPGELNDPRMGVLRTMGFRVDETDELPGNEAFAVYHAVIVRPAGTCNLPMLATRLRAKPRFGRRVLMALVSDAVVARDQREALLSGFDATIPVDCGARDLAATILRLLRPIPEFRCLLLSPRGRRQAA